MDTTLDMLRSAEDFRRKILASEPYRKVVAEVEEDEEPLGEYQAAEYIIFSLALATYLRHLGETVEVRVQRAQAERTALVQKFKTEGMDDPALAEDLKDIEGQIRQLESFGNPIDKVAKTGLMLLRRIDRDLESFQSFVEGHLQRDSQKNMLERTLRRPARDAGGAGRRALNLRTLMRDPKVIRGVFETAQARRQIKAAIAAQTMDDGDAALDLFVAMPATVLRNPLIRKWIKLAADTAQPLQTIGTMPEVEPETGTPVPPVAAPPRVSTPQPSPVVEAASAAVEQTPNILAQQTQEAGTTGAAASKDAQVAQGNLLESVQQKSTEAARDALERKGEPDIPPVKSEVVGIATAAAVAAMSDPSNPQNVPETIKKLDPEQRAAAMTDGRVLVAAGAGSGKSTTLVARVNHLVRDRGVAPHRVLVTSFNTSAAEELKIKLGKAAGGDMASSMQVGTMHSLFKRFVLKYGNKSEKEAMSTPDPQRAASLVARTVQSIWETCFDKENMPTPPIKEVKQQMELWVGNNISVEQAKTEAVGRKQQIAAQWYEMYEGLKGALLGWEPPCEAKAREAADEDYQEKYQRWERSGGRGRPPQRPMTSYEWFMSKSRPDGKRVGDFNDMIRMFRDVLQRSPDVRKEVQSLFDHILVDECQDLNQVQFEAFQMMTEHVGDGKNGKSVWMVGDVNQSIYGFRGSRPDLFQGLYEREGWTTRVIRTNYRCAPEIVGHANQLIAHNESRLPIEANAAPGRHAGEAQLEVTTPPDAETGAIEVVKRIVEAKGSNPLAADSDFAVLARTNKELHAYEAACLIQGIPYARKGASSFLGSPEVKGLLGYVDLVMGTDNEKLQSSLANVINVPRRFWGLDMEQSERAVKDAVRDYARMMRMDSKSINPVEALRDSSFRDMLGKRLGSGFPGSMKYKDVMSQIEDLGDFVDDMQAASAQPGFGVKDLFNEVLMIEGKVREIDPDTGRPVFKTRSFRASIEASNRDRDDGDEIEAADEGEEEETSGLGNISFLYELAKIDPNNPPDVEEDPSTPGGFLRKMDQLRERAKDLRINTEKWKAEQKNLPPDQRVPPPGVYLGTAHSVKGGQWPNVFVQMPKDKFPMKFRRDPDPDAPPPTEEELQEHMEQERRLAYVALTRAETRLSVVCPQEIGNAGGISPFVEEAGLEVYMTSPASPEPPPSAEVEPLAEGVPKEASTWIPFDDPFTTSWDPFEERG